MAEFSGKLECYNKSGKIIKIIDLRHSMEHRLWLTYQVHTRSKQYG